MLSSTCRRIARSTWVSMVSLAPGMLATSMRERMLARYVGLKCTGIGNKFATAVCEKISEPPFVMMFNSLFAGQGSMLCTRFLLQYTDTVEHVPSRTQAGSMVANCCWLRTN